MTDEERLHMVTEQLILVRDNLFRGMSKSMQKLQARSINEALELENFIGSAQPHMTTNLHDKMLAAIDAYFSASDGDERDQAEEQLLDVRDELLKQPAQPAPTEADLMRCWVEKPNGEIDGIASMKKVLEKFGSAQQPAREWVGLTDEEIDQGLLRSDYAFKTAEAWRAGVVFAMTKLKEKNT